MNCLNCGYQSADDFSVCPYCGEAMEQENTEVKKKPKSKLLLWIILGAILAAVILAAALLLCPDTDVDTDTDTAVSPELKYEWGARPSALVNVEKTDESGDGNVYTCYDRDHDVDRFDNIGIMDNEVKYYFDSDDNLFRIVYETEADADTTVKTLVLCLGEDFYQDGDGMYYWRIHDTLIRSACTGENGKIMYYDLNRVKENGDYTDVVNYFRNKDAERNDPEPRSGEVQLMYPWEMTVTDFTEEETSYQETYITGFVSTNFLVEDPEHSVDPLKNLEYTNVFWEKGVYFEFMEDKLRGIMYAAMFEGNRQELESYLKQEFGEDCYQFGPDEHCRYFWWLGDTVVECEVSYSENSEESVLCIMNYYYGPSYLKRSYRNLEAVAYFSKD